jgi:hypothetical protein
VEHTHSLAFGASNVMALDFDTILALVTLEDAMNRIAPQHDVIFLHLGAGHI